MEPKAFEMPQELTLAEALQTEEEKTNGVGDEKARKCFTILTKGAFVSKEQ